MASAHCSAISSELGVLGENITQEGLFLGNEGLGGWGLADMPAVGKDSNFICLVQRRQNSACLST